MLGRVLVETHLLCQAWLCPAYREVSAAHPLLAALLKGCQSQSPSRHGSPKSLSTYRAGCVGACVRDRWVSHPGEKQPGPAAGSVTCRGDGSMQASGQGPRSCVSHVPSKLLEGRNRVGTSPDHRRLSSRGPQLPTGKTDPNHYSSLLVVLCSGTAGQAVIDKPPWSLGGLLRGYFTSRSSLDQFATC